MTKLELNLESENYTMSCNTYAAKSHYKSLMCIGRVFPSTPAQIKYFLKEGVCLSVLNSKDVEIVESMLNKYGFIGNYKYTKSKSWCRLRNSLDLQKAFELELKEIVQ